MITKIPETLVIALTRHGHDGVAPTKLEKRIRCPFKLDLSSYVSQPSEGIENYELCAVVTHKGPTTFTGHYICYAKHSTQWYKIDDTVVCSALAGHYVSFISMPEFAAPLTIYMLGLFAG